MQNVWYPPQIQIEQADQRMPFDWLKPCDVIKDGRPDQFGQDSVGFNGNDEHERASGRQIEDNLYSFNLERSDEIKIKEEEIVVDN